MLSSDDGVYQPLDEPPYNFCRVSLRKQIVTKTASDIKLIQELVKETNNGSKELKKLHNQNSNTHSEYIFL